MVQAYIPILIMTVIAGGFAAVALIIAWLLAPTKPDLSKDSPYECGVPPVGDARERFSVRFYVVAMLFIVFDLETVFLVPWAVQVKELGWSAFLAVALFVVVLAVGLLYEWKKGGLEWD